MCVESMAFLAAGAMEDKGFSAVEAGEGEARQGKRSCRGRR